ncbi:hypothetical protein [Microbacterium sp. 22242]|uniref:hypothetical protein n=1 Tax=Microbacterium sp. 22242 TaxID=3453896 RepID=UPI003F83F174
MMNSILQNSIDVRFKLKKEEKIIEEKSHTREGSRYADRSNLAARTLDAAEDTVSRIATDGRPVTEMADEVIARAGWLPARDTAEGVVPGGRF